MRILILASILFSLSCSTPAATGEETTGRNSPAATPAPTSTLKTGSTKTLPAAFARFPLVIKAHVVTGGVGDKYYRYDITPLSILKNTSKVTISGNLTVSRVNYESQPDPNKTYLMGLAPYNPSNPRAGFKIVHFAKP